MFGIVLQYSRFFMSVLSVRSCGGMFLNRAACELVCRSVAHGYSVATRHILVCYFIACLTMDYSNSALCAFIYVCISVSVCTSIPVCISVSVCAGSQRITETDYDDGIGVVATGGWEGPRQCQPWHFSVLCALEYPKREKQPIAGLPFLRKSLLLCWRQCTDHRSWHIWHVSFIPYW